MAKALAVPLPMVLVLVLLLSLVKVIVFSMPMLMFKVMAVVITVFMVGVIDLVANYWELSVAIKLVSACHYLNRSSNQLLSVLN